MNKKIEVSALNKTWILDLDGTIVKHNGYKLDGYDTFLDGAEEFLKNIPEEDMVIFITSRKQEECSFITEDFLHNHNIHYNAIIWGAPYGERILINDRKPSGLITSVAINAERDCFFQEKFIVNKQL